MTSQQNLLEIQSIPKVGCGMEEVLLEIQDLWVEYRTFKGVARAVNGVWLSVHSGESVGLVGETGAGKTSTALSVLRVLPPRTGRVARGRVLFNGQDLLALPETAMGAIRGRSIAMVFQNPLTSLNPVFTVKQQMSDVLVQHEKLTKKQAEIRARELLELVGIASYRINDYPHQFSGGMRQRVGIAIALSCNPSVLIADEPTTALDVTIQAQVLELIRELQRRFGTGMLLITHNLGVVAEMCNRVAVMYSGRIVERGIVDRVFTTPKHPYTVGLLRALPRLEGGAERLEPIPGGMPDPLQLPTGCKFHPRCKHAIYRCNVEEPTEVQITNDHFVACFNVL